MAPQLQPHIVPDSLVVIGSATATAAAVGDWGLGVVVCMSGCSRLRSIFVDDELGDVTDKPRDTRMADRRGVMGLQASSSSS